MTRKIDNYENALEYIYSFKGTKPIFTNSVVLNYIIDSELKIKEKVDCLKVIQITGTDGKGSVCRYLETIFKQSDVKTIVYTSPHINTARERIRIDNIIISKTLFLRKLKYLYPYLEKLRETKYHVGPYQIVFLICLLIHVNIFPEYVGIYEVAIGGASDETNVFINQVVGITEITNDHLDIFGSFEDLVKEKIGLADKAGIVILKRQNPLAKRIITEYCKVNLIPFQYINYEQACQFDSDFLIPGQYQRTNYLLAEKCAEAFSKQYAFRIFTQLRSLVKLNGRMQETIVSGKRLIIDTGHTIAAVASLCSYAKEQNSMKALIFACSAKRNAKEIIDLIISKGVFNTICFTQILSFGGTPANELLDMAKKELVPCYAQTNLLTALKFLIKSKSETIYIFGSFRLSRDLDISLIELGYEPIISNSEDIDPNPGWHRSLN